MPLCRCIAGVFRTFIDAWERLQVELHGQYSLARMDELLAFTRETGPLHMVTIAVLTPLACVVTIIAPDMLPLRPPADGVLHQSVNYWARLFFTTAVPSAVVILHVKQVSPRLQLRWTHLAVATTLVSAALTGVFFVFHLLVGFPTPFIIPLTAPVWQMLLSIPMALMWKTVILADVEIQQDLNQFTWFFSSQFAMTLVYPIMIFVVGRLNGVHQTLFSLLFPVVKLLLKNWASRGVYHLEDLAPVFVVLSVDVFHALLLSCAMRSATSRGTFISAMATDVFQSLVAVVQVRIITTQLKQHRLEILAANTATPFLWDQMHEHTNVLLLASSLLESHPELRADPALALPRHRRPSLLGLARVANGPRVSSVVTRTQIVPSCPPPRPIARIASGTVRASTLPKRPPQVEYVRLSLQLLHMVECYVLVEFTEVIVAVIYAIYLVAMFHLPNRNYYLALKTLSQDQLMEAVGHVLTYAALELLSLVVLCVVLDWLVGFSTLRLLAFTLRKHALLAQSLLVFWVFTATQLTLEHFGNDYTFRFQWLRHADKDN